VALQGFLVPTGYARIGNVSYDHRNRKVSYDVSVYEDSTAKNIINVVSLHVYSKGNPILVSGYAATEPSDPEELPVGSSRVFITNTSDVYGYKNHPVRYVDALDSEGNPTREIEGDTPYHGMLLKVSSDNKVYSWEESSGWEEQDPVLFMTDDTWDSHFHLSSMSPAYKDIVAVLYDYTKLRPEFSGCTDV
jgi:hypothetical protein